MKKFNEIQRNVDEINEHLRKSTSKKLKTNLKEPLENIEKLTKELETEYQKQSELIKKKPKAKVSKKETSIKMSETHNVEIKYMSRSEINKLLTNTKPTTHEEWLNVGEALYKIHNGSQLGLGQWSKWSRGFKSYLECHNKWFKI